MNDKSTGAGYGAMIGYKWRIFSIGIEGLMSTLTNKDKLIKTKTDLEAQDYGPYLRWDWGRVNFSLAFYTSQAKDESLKQGGLKETLKGSGMRAGLGFRVFKHFSINVDYIAVDYTKADEPSFLAMKAERTSTLVGVSFPFGLDGK